MKGGLQVLSALVCLFTLACTKATPEPASTHRVRVVERLPHDVEAFTQGLLIDGGNWLESTGLYGRSELREVERSTGKVIRNKNLEAALFGEGLALHGGLLYQLTWREGLCIVYDRNTFEERRRFRYTGEGWGLASDGRHLYRSDGSSTIRVLDPETFEEKRRFNVVGPRGPVNQLNELEIVRGELWANVFRTGWIARIRISDGRVIGFLDLHSLPPSQDQHAEQDVLNGIAYDAETDAVWVTGKYWKALYRIEIGHTPP